MVFSRFLLGRGWGGVFNKLRRSLSRSCVSSSVGFLAMPDKFTPLSQTLGFDHDYAAAIGYFLIAFSNLEEEMKSRRVDHAQYPER